MEEVISVGEARANLSRLIKRVEAGERIVISQAGRPVAILSRYEGRPPRRVPGTDKIVIHPNFDDPIPEWDPDYMHPEDPMRDVVR